MSSERPRLTLRFGTRSKLWADVVHALREQLFVETTLALKVDARVDLSVFAPALEKALDLEGTVVQVRAGDGALQAGVVVRLAETSVARCREALNAPRNDAMRTTGRSEPRLEGQLAARVTFPDVVPGCTVRGLSQNGLTLNCTKAYAAGTVLELMVSAGGGEVKVTGAVNWSRPELGLCGLLLRDTGAEAIDRLVKALTQGNPSTMPRSATVVIADDDAEIVELVTKVVKGAGHKVLSAGRGDQALELIRKEHPALAFLDILMPGLDGLEVCRALRADAGLSRIQVVLLSAMNEQRLEEVASAVGANAWLTKPMRIAAVRVVMEKVLR
jgi:CheY-like chemotaxis protein